MKKITGFFTKTRVLEIIILILLAIGMFVLNYTTYAVNQDNVPAGYLSIQDMALYDPATNKTYLPRKTDDSYYSFYNSSYSPGYRTTKGITVGATWDEFVEAYGDYICAFTSGYPVNYDTNESYDKYYQRYIHVKDFDEQFIKTGDLDLNAWNLSIRFEIYTQGTKAYYTEEEVDGLLDRYYAHMFWLFDQPVTFGHLKYNTYHLNFSFAPDEETGQCLLWYISSDLY